VHITLLVVALKPGQVVAILLAAALQFGCGAAPKLSAPSASAVRPVLSLKQLMEWVIDPAADAV
jgi:hypothetical protein